MFCLMRFFSILFVIFFYSSSIAGDKLPEPVTWNTELKELVFDEDEKFFDGKGVLELETPYRALDAAMVPINVKFLNNQSKDNYVKSLTLIVDENPSPVVSRFDFSHKIGNASLTTRIRVDKYTYVRAIAGSLNKAELLISHPNYSGLQFNQLTRAEIPAHFVNHIKVEQDGEMILEAHPDISLSEDPSIRFHYLDSGGPLEITVEDSEGQKFASEYSSSQMITSK